MKRIMLRKSSLRRHDPRQNITGGLSALPKRNDIDHYGNHLATGGKASSICSIQLRIKVRSKPAIGVTPSGASPSRACAKDSRLRSISRARSAVSRRGMDRSARHSRLDRAVPLNRCKHVLGFFGEVYQPVVEHDQGGARLKADAFEGRKRREIIDARTKEIGSDRGSTALLGIGQQVGE